MKLTAETANNINVGDYIRIDYGGGVAIEGAVYAIDPTEGLWIDLPDGRQRVHGPAIFRQNGTDITWPQEHPEMVRGHNGHFAVVPNET